MTRNRGAKTDIGGIEVIAEYKKRRQKTNVVQRRIVLEI